MSMLPSYWLAEYSTYPLVISGMLAIDSNVLKTDGQLHILPTILEITIFVRLYCCNRREEK